MMGDKTVKIELTNAAEVLLYSCIFNDRAYCPEGSPIPYIRDDESREYAVCGSSGDDETHHPSLVFKPWGYRCQLTLFSAAPVIRVAQSILKDGITYTNSGEPSIDFQYGFAATFAVFRCENHWIELPTVQGQF